MNASRVDELRMSLGAGYDKLDLAADSAELARLLRVQMSLQVCVCICYECFATITLYVALRRTSRIAHTRSYDGLNETLRSTHLTYGSRSQGNRTRDRVCLVISNSPSHMRLPDMIVPKQAREIYKDVSCQATKQHRREIRPPFRRNA